MPPTIEILERLIAFPTVSRDSNLDLIAYVRELLEAKGIESRLVFDGGQQKANLFATVGPADRPGVMLSGHSDVVPVEGQDWSVDPFRLAERDGRFYGRGTADMKGFIAAAIRAVLDAADRDLHTPLHLALSYDEELGCLGVHGLIDMMEEAAIRPAFCIVGEPTNMGVATGHKGKLAARARCIGREGHSALAPMALNAIHLATDFVGELRRIQAEIVENGPRDGDYDVPYTTVHVGRIQGGVALNIVPNLCEVHFEIRNLNADDPEAIYAEIRRAAGAIAEQARRHAPEADIRFEVTNTYPGLDTPPDAEVVAFVKALTGANSTFKVAFGTEGGLFTDKLDTPTVVCGPGSMAQGHKPDEYVTVDQLARCDAMLDALIDRLCR